MPKDPINTFRDADYFRIYSLLYDLFYVGGASVQRKAFMIVAEEDGIVPSGMQNVSFLNSGDVNVTLSSELIADVYLTPGTEVVFRTNGNDTMNEISYSFGIIPDEQKAELTISASQ